MLMDALSALVYEIFLETFYWKRKKQLIFFFIAFYILYESNIKTFLKLSTNKCFMGTY